ncbi:type II toxin-antitoxin system YhaV family toxin [Cupriavidus basilensis]|uniref:type II toxin-antitoxin system YhaV family toxin n=1 Tax=Cupriavidus basilensis TaxID=68895 RepID=UPI00284303B9|nr:type II toxin-antitoxin system YhaV family toxin [Cupriavidus basilensis]MDR3383093.1 type II toxin-antitoxin system YhaV family toxin [Cupriavidus basilensis]
MSASRLAPLVINGWTVFAHPLFLAQLEGLTQQVEALKQRDPAGYVKKSASNLAGGDHKHWFRAKFFQQYRLFFRYHAQSKVIVFAWVNDEDTKRAFESSDDAYRVFRKMLENGHPPDDWHQLLAEARAEGLRLQRMAAGAAQVQP